jgi:DNA-binding NtrC family response regulator
MAPSANRILVADDDTEILSEVVSYLRRRGQAVIATSSYGEAVQAYNDNADSIGLVLTDIRMPDGDGTDLARMVILRSEGKCPCLMMSGDTGWNDLAPDLKRAGVRSIEKPFGLSLLYASVLGALATAVDVASFSA